MARTDIHRPAEIDPEDYFCVGWGDSLEPQGSYFDIDRIAHIQATGHKTTRATGFPLADIRYIEPHNENPRQCQHCGAHIRYIVTYIHIPSGDLMRVGEICADKLSLGSKDEMKARAMERYLPFRRGRFLMRNPHARKAIEICVEQMIIAEERKKGERVFVNPFLFDIGRRFMRDAWLSDNQIKAVYRVDTQIKEKLAQIAAERANDPDPAPIPVDNERIEIRGKILKMKYTETQFGPYYKITVLDDRGFKVWGTAPQAIEEAKKGDRVKFSAKVRKSPDDETFGFYSRPTKASIEQNNPS